MNWEKYLNAKRLRTSGRETTNDPRNEFESDFGRVIFSPAIRRMHDKTQVFPLTSDDNIHSRLTHSMEVMAIGHSLGIRLCEDETFQTHVDRELHTILREIPVLLKNSCLVHDIGNPPFGHFGETVIQDYFSNLFTTQEICFHLNEVERQDFTKFDGNAQGFRVLTKLQVLDDKYGLNLTYATLASYLKYPNTGKIDKKIISKKKRGVFQSEKDFLDIIFKDCDLIQGDLYKRHPLSYLMEAADSICYSVMDIEDGFNKGWYSYNFIKDKLSQVNGMSDIFTRIEKNDTETGKEPSEIKKIVNLRINLISLLVKLAIENFIKNYADICNGDYNEELIYHDENKLAKTLQIFCVEYIFPKQEIQSLELTGHSVLSGLLDFYIGFLFKDNKDYMKRAVGMISNSVIKAAALENNFNLSENTNEYYKFFEKYDEDAPKKEIFSDYYKLRIIVDFISGMTDQYALEHYQKLSGQKIR